MTRVFAAPSQPAAARAQREAGASPAVPAGAVAEAPTRAPGGHTFTRVACGFFTTCAIDSNTRLWCWGDGRDGELGEGVLPDGGGRLAPVMSDNGSTGWSRVAVGRQYACGIRNGVLY